MDLVAVIKLFLINCIRLYCLSLAKAWFDCFYVVHKYFFYRIIIKGKGGEVA